jgi:2-C-methyl-D-erythritol 2,4-cyclodiphosphate synthase
VVVDTTKGVIATSDGDVAAHALADAVLGAACLGDLGTFFPSSDPRWRGADSVGLLEEAVGLALKAGLEILFADLTIVVEDVRVAPHREAMRARLAGGLGIAVESMSVKATTTDGLGFIGAGQGLAAMAVVTARTL